MLNGCIYGVSNGIGDIASQQSSRHWSVSRYWLPGLVSLMELRRRGKESTSVVSPNKATAVN